MSGGSSNNGKNGQNGPQTIYDTDVRIEYQGTWSLNSTTGKNGQDLTSHSTANPKSTAFLSFHGAQIHVIGEITPGQDALAANYTIDGGQPSYRAEPTLAQNSSIPNQMLYSSPLLPLGDHTITIDVLETGGDRNYTLWSFQVDVGDDDGKQGPNVGAIVGGVLGAIVFLLLFLGTIYFWQRRRIAQNSHYGQVPQMGWYAQPMSDGPPTGGRMITRESYGGSDADPKFTFDVHRSLQKSSRRKSWVPISVPPNVVVSSRAPSDWSSYKGSSVIVERSEAVERSHFSPYTTTSFSPMTFRQPALPPAEPMRVEESSVSGSLNGRAI